MEFWIRYCIGIVMGVLMTAVKNTQSKEAMKARFHDVFQTILMVYPEFANEIVSVVAGPYSGDPSVLSGNYAQENQQLMAHLNEMALKYVNETMESSQKIG